MKQVIMKLDDELVKEAKIMAIRKDMPFQRFIEYLIKEEIKRLKKEEL